MIELQPVKRGNLVRLSVDGKDRLYRARRSVRDIGNLRLCDLQPDPVSDANAMMQRVIDREQSDG